MIQTNGIDEEDADSFEEVVLALLNPLLAEISWLARDVSASHVLRSAISLLMGLPVIAERKGKASKHQHSVSYSVTLDTLLTPGHLTIDRRHFFDVPSGFYEAIERTIESLSESESSILHELLADTSSCAVMTLLYRVASASHPLSRGPELSETLLRRILEWSTDSEAVNTELFYAMAGDKCASHFLEMAIEVTALDIILPVLEAALAERVGEYAKDGAANFIVQAAMRRLCLELEQLSAPTGDVLLRVLNLSSLLIEETMDSTLLPDLLSHKGGVVLWMITLSKPFIDACESTDKKVGKQLSSKSSGLRQRIGQALIDHWSSLKKSSAESLAEIIYRRLTTSSTASSSEDATAGGDGLASSSSPDGKSSSSKAGPADSAQLMLARQLGALLRLKSSSMVDNTESKALETVAAIVGGMPTEVLSHVALSGQLSRGLLDPFIDLHSQSSHFGKFMKSFVAIAGTLAGHYVGQHLFRNAFESAGYKDKERMVQQLVSEKDILSRTKEGRGSLRLVDAEGYSHDAEDWMRSMKRQARAHDMLAELEGTREPTSAAIGGGSAQRVKSQPPSAAQSESVTTVVPPKRTISHIPSFESSYNSIQVDEQEDTTTALGASESEALQQGKKRKRKRPQKGAKKVTSFDPDNEEADDDEEQEQDLQDHEDKAPPSQPVKVALPDVKSTFIPAASRSLSNSERSYERATKESTFSEANRSINQDRNHHRSDKQYQHRSANYSSGGKESGGYSAQNRYDNRRSDADRTKQIKQLWHLSSKQVLQAAEQLVVQDKKQRK